MSTIPRVCIVGGGLVGISFALALRRAVPAAGLDITLLESFPLRPAPTQPVQAASDLDARSTALSWGTREIYRRLGLWDAIAPGACAIRAIHVSEQGRVGVTRMQAEESGVPALGYVVENAALGQALLGALAEAAGIEVLAPVEVERIRPVERGQALHFRPAGDAGTRAEAGEQERFADLLVLCDGGRSGLCGQQGLGARSTDYAQQAIVFNVRGARDHDGVAFERFTPSGPMALLPLAGRRRAVICTLAPETAAAWRAEPDEKLADLLQARFGSRLGIVEAVGRRGMHPLELRVAGEQARPGLVVLGNAAHTLHPVAGQGFNLSMRDVDLLAATVARQVARQAPVGDLAALRGYQDARLDDQDGVIGFTHGLNRLFSGRLAAMGPLRSAALVSLDLLTPARRLLAGHAMGMA